MTRDDLTRALGGTFNNTNPQTLNNPNNLNITNTLTMILNKPLPLLLLSALSFCSLAADVDFSFPSQSNYALIDSIEVNMSDVIEDNICDLDWDGGNGKSCQLSTTIESYFDEAITVEPDDVLVVRAVVAITHQPDEGSPEFSSVARALSYLTCDGVRISAYRSKSIKRQGGNHHGAMVASGFCHYNKTTNGQVNIELKVRSDLDNGLIDFANQTKMYVDRFGKVDPVSSPLDAYYMATTKLKASPPSSLAVINGAETRGENNLTVHNIDKTRPALNNGILTFQDPVHHFVFPLPENKIRNSATFYEWQSLPLSGLESDSWVFLNAQASAERPNTGVPLFGLQLVQVKQSSNSLTRSVLAAATENPTPSELYRLSQNVYGALKTTNTTSSVDIKTRIYSLETAPNKPSLDARASQARLEGLVFEKGLRAESMFLKKIYIEYPPADVLVDEHQKVFNIGRDRQGQGLPVVFSEDKGLLRIKSHASLEYTGADVRSCYSRIKVFKDDGLGGEYFREFSVPAGRYLKAPYKYHNLTSELIYQVTEAGTYRVEPFVYCSRRDINDSDVVIENSGTWTLVEKYEQ